MADHFVMPYDGMQFANIFRQPGMRTPDRGETMNESEKTRTSTGIEGLDEILNGGFLSGRSYLVRGGPGTGKTTLGLHFLVCGVQNGENALFITLEEPADKIREDGNRLGFNLEGIHFLDLSPSSEFFAQSESYDLFSPAEIEREPITKQIVETITRIKPSRIFLDPLTQFRYLSSNLFLFRKQALSFMRYLNDLGATLLLTSEQSSEAPDEDLQFMVDGIIDLKHYEKGSTISILKLRGSGFKGLKHSMRLTSSGIQVFPRIVPQAAFKDYAFEQLPSGVPELDQMTNGGLERGTVTIFSGPSGTGKTTLGFQFMREAAGRGERSIVYSFDEAVPIMIQRCESISIPAKAMINHGSLLVQKIEPMRYSSNEFARMVRNEVERNDARLIMIDSIAGYALSVHGDSIVNSLHSLCKYLQHMGVSVILIAETSNLLGSSQVTDVKISYLADSIINLRYLEMKGGLHKAIGVVKKRLSDFEKTLREFEITKSGIRVGKPLFSLRHIMSDKPELIEPETS